MKLEANIHLLRGEIRNEKFINYKNSPLNARKYYKQVSFIPKDVLSKLSYKVDTTINTSIDSNDKSEIINNKSEIRKGLDELRKSLKEKRIIK